MYKCNQRKNDKKNNNQKQQYLQKHKKNAPSIFHTHKNNHIKDILLPANDKRIQPYQM